MSDHHRFHQVFFWATVAVVLTTGVQAVADVSVNFTGEVARVRQDDVGIFPGVSPGDPVTGSFSYDLNTPLYAQTSPGTAFYLTGSISIQIGPLSFTGNGSWDDETIIFNDRPTFDGELHDAVRINNSFDCGDRSQMAIDLSDEDATVFNDVALPIVFPDLSEFESETDGAKIYCASGTDESFLSINFLSMSHRSKDHVLPSAPTVSTWGVTVLALLLVAGLTIKFRVASMQRKAT